MLPLAYGLMARDARGAKTLKHVNASFVLKASLAINAALATIIAIHLHQDAAYWDTLEQTVQAERDARVQWEKHAAMVRTKSAQAVSAFSHAPDEQKETGASKQGENHAPCPRCEPCGDDDRPAQQPCPKHTERTPNVQAAAADGINGYAIAGTPLLRAGYESSSAMPEFKTYSPVFDPSSNNGLDFKVFVYELPDEFHVELKRQQKRCISDQYGTEIRIHEDLLKSPLRTLDPEEAEFFYVPWYGECFLFREEKRDHKNAISTTNKWFIRAVNIVKQEYPYFNRTLGRDHVFVFPGARGPHIFRDWKRHIRKSIFMTPEGDRSLGEQFNTWKDVIIPGLEADVELTSGKTRELDGERNQLAFFRGTIWNKGGSSYSRGIRIKMADALKGVTDVTFGEAEKSCDRACYRREMRRSVYCLCPRGWSPWTLRAYSAMMAGCIPVILADEIEFPYENFLNWNALTVKIPEAQAEDVVQILRSIPQSVVEQKQAAIARVWKMVTWKHPAEPGDAFHTVMADLGLKRRLMKASTYTFWDHDHVKRSS